jgi:hypothetical protein
MWITLFVLEPLRVLASIGGALKAFSNAMLFLVASSAT